MRTKSPLALFFSATFLSFLLPLISVAESPSPTDVPQIPLCMIGDSITWAQEGDYWRQNMLKELPSLAFVGTHSAKLGFSHAGEGGNNTGRVLGRLNDIPDCAYYSLCIGTNDNNLKDEAIIEKHAAGTADRVEQIVLGLLKKPSVKKVFLCSIIPCKTDNPLRDKTNSATNVVLRKKMETSLPKDKVVWVELEKPIRAIPNWEPMILLHPTQDGYKVLGKLLADAIATNLGIKDRTAVPKPQPGCGVRIDNLWQGDASGHTRIPVIAGWWTVSFDLVKVTGGKPAITIQGPAEIAKGRLNKSFPIKADLAGKRVTVELFTEHEGYKYTRSTLGITTADCEIGRILFEKRRPSGQASVYGEGSYIDSKTPSALGELVERP